VDHHSQIDHGTQRQSRGSVSGGRADHFGNHHYFDGDEAILANDTSREIALPSNSSCQALHRLEHGSDRTVPVLAPPFNYRVIDCFHTVNDCWVVWQKII